ncbi:hypothetical protein KXS07_30455 [Inquilinus limosus]|uniref:hypothetical protein n=1 Tax=Inquilinus limosus TaxID=171674 RepID=UPI00041EC77E|nr:hypothetical protein [Inquilinus limosus]
MCGVCGVLGGEEHWTAESARPEVFGAGRTRRAERLRRAAAANRILSLFGLRLDDWQGSAFVLSGPTGRQEIVDALPAVWEAASRLLGRKIDPLDPALLDRIAGGGR